MVINLGPKASQTIAKMGDLTPTMQRLIIGATALPMMTTIDAFNPYVDKQTRKTSAIRTAIKTVICTASGLLTRVIASKVGEKLVKNGKLAIPAGVDKAAYIGSVSKVFAVLGGIASVFIIDLPFINQILNAVMKKVKPATPAPTEQKGQVNHYV